MISRRTIAHLHYERMTQAPTQPAFFYPQNGEFLPMLNKDVLQAYVEIGLGLWELGVRHGDRVHIYVQGLCFQQSTCSNANLQSERAAEAAEHAAE